MGKKWVGYVKYSVLGVGVIGVAVGLPFAVINSKSYDLFAEIIVSDNTSVLADSSFSETTYNGFQKFVNTKEGKNVLPTASSIPQSSGVWRRPGDTTFSRETTFRGLFASGKDMLIAPGFNHETAIRNVATDPNFSDKGFLLLDSAVENVTNVSSFIFRADQSGFLTGIAACIFLNNNKEIFTTNHSKELKVGAFVGLAFPSTMDFLAGFQAGVFAWNQHVKSDTSKGNPVEWISLGDKDSDYTSGGFGVGGGVEKADLLLSRGADVIMAIAGPQTADVVGQIVSKKLTAVVAGVDSAQETQTINKPLPLLDGKTIKGGFKPASGDYMGKDMVIQFSAVKHLD
ncbi:MAG: BMP family ABC transporter substrate-binding protein, partial [Malacoplasma sp.]